MIIVTGWRSQIAVELRRMLPADEAAMRGDCTVGRLPNADRYLFCQGLLRAKTAHEQTPDEQNEGYVVNYRSIAAACDEIFERNHAARVCVVGSESGFRGSYDGIYGAAKADLHAYVENKVLRPNQQLVAVSPSIVGDASMTLRRQDVENLERRRAEHPKQRFLTAREVALTIFHLLYVDEGYITGTVVRMHGANQ